MPIKIPKISGEIKSGVLHQVLKKELSSWRNKPLIYLVDKVYQLIGLSEMERFLREDKTDLIKYVPEYFDCPMTSDLAYGMGLFFADGSCNGRAWRIVNKNKEVLETTKSAFNDIFKKDGVRFDLRLWDSYKKGTETNYGKRNHDEWSLDMYVTNPNGLTGTLKDGNRLKMIREFRKMFYFNNGKKFPAGIIESDLPTKKAFLKGLIEGDGTIISKNRGQLTVNGKIALAETAKLMTDLNWKFSIREEPRSNQVWYVYYNKKTEEFDESRNGCDDFSFRLMGQFSIPEWSGIAFGIAFSQVHAFNLFLNEKKEIFCIEPQSDKIWLISEIPKKYRKSFLPIKFVLM